MATNLIPGTVIPARRTSLPILLKGILHPADAVAAIEHGMDGIVVSNHGGRQVDGSIATMDALPAIVEAVAGRVPVLLDSGVRSALQEVVECHYCVVDGFFI